MLGSFQIIGIAVLLSILQYILIPIFGKRMRKMGIVGIDLHKLNKPKVPFVGFSLFLFSVLFLTFSWLITKDIRIIHIMLMSSVFTIFGFADDRVKMNKYQKIFWSFLVGIAAVLIAGINGVWSIIYFIFFIVIANIFNIFAGFNGLSIGSSTIASFFLAACSFLLGMLTPSLLLFGMSFILLSFLIHNKYPSKVFPGNTGTMLIGGFFASISLYYNLFPIIIPLLTLHIIHCLIKGIPFKAEVKVTQIAKNGTLKPQKGFKSLFTLILRKKPMGEKQLVELIWMLQILIGIILTLLVVFFR